MEDLIPHQNEENYNESNENNFKEFILYISIYLFLSIFGKILNYIQEKISEKKVLTFIIR